jgi:lactoylglutathione lyase
MATYDHVAFQTADMDAAVGFYVEKLGFQLASRALNAQEQEEYAFLTLDDLRLELIQDLKRPDFAIPEPSPPYCPHLAIETGDMEQAVQHLKQNGVRILRGPLVIEGEETWVYFADRDNNVLEYIQWFRKK